MLDKRITRAGPKLAAIDLDGTLLDAEASLSMGNATALSRLHKAGVHIVLASGRHHLNMRRYAAQMPGVEWLISCQGGQVADLSRETVLTTHFLTQAALPELLAVGTSLGFTTLVYRVNTVQTAARRNDDIDFYTALAGTAPVWCPPEELRSGDAFKVLWVGAPSRITHARALNPGQIPGTQMVQTHERILEFMPSGISKATGLDVLTKQLGMTSAEVIAFGDGENDIPMFDWAGISVAMAHGWAAALKRASYISSAGPVGTAFERAVDFLFARGMVNEEKENGVLMSDCYQPNHRAGDRNQGCNHRFSGHKA